MAREITEQVFLNDVSAHQMKLMLDQGLYRHLRFASSGPHSWNQWFEIITWPGRLAYSGDMGTFVFARLEDMFEFFRTKPSEERGLYINLGYWAEKLEAVDRNGRINDALQYSEEVFAARVNDAVAEWIEEYSLGKPEQARLREAIEEDVLRCADEGEDEAHRALRDFKCQFGGHTFKFQDTWEWDLREYTGRFVWCCYAIAWAIRQYDSQKKSEAAA